MASPISRLHALRRRVLLLGIVGLIALAVHLILFVIATVRIGQGPDEVSAPPWIGWTGTATASSDPVVREQSLLLDAEPLFVPTPWNAASSLDEIARLRDEAELFAAFPPRLARSDQLWEPPPPPAVAPLAEQLRGSSAVSPFAPFGSAPSANLAGLSARRPVQASLEIFDLADGQPVLASRAFEASGVAPPANVWSPLEFLLVVDSALGGGFPLLLNSSGSPEWDQSVARSLLGTRLLAELPQGYFRIVVGP